jgi:hypothetical protein
MWDVAVDRTGSIDILRDSIVPMRNVHYTFINQLIRDATNHAAKLGLEIAFTVINLKPAKTFGLGRRIDHHRQDHLRRSGH